MIREGPLLRLRCGVPGRIGVARLPVRQPSARVPQLMPSTRNSARADDDEQDDRNDEQMCRRQQPLEHRAMVDLVTSPNEVVVHPEVRDLLFIHLPAQGVYTAGSRRRLPRLSYSAHPVVRTFARVNRRQFLVGALTTCTRPTGRKRRAQLPAGVRRRRDFAV